MPEIKETTVYKFDELSDVAKQKARDWYTEDGLDYEWWEGVYEQTKVAAKCLGIELAQKGKHAPAIYFSGFSSQGDGACFEGKYRYRKGWRKALAVAFGDNALTELLEIGQDLMAAQAPQFYRLEAVCAQRGHYYHSGCMDVEVTHDDSIYRDIGDSEDGVRDALRSFADWIYTSLEREYDYLTADEQVDESIRSNEYEFLEDGSRA